MNNVKDTRYTVLIVDGNLDTLELISADLQDTYHVLKTSTGEDAWRKIESHHIDLVIGDVSSPRINGYELCSLIKHNINFSHIPFIMLTSNNNMEAKIEVLNSDADAYLEKPFSSTILQAQIRSLLRNRRHIYEHYTKTTVVSPATVVSSRSDFAFLEKINHFIHEHISEHDLCVDLLADKMNMSRPTLYRKIKTISNLSPNELINMSRLKKATEYLLSKDFKIYEIASLVGFNSSSHFTRNFQKQFGISPKDYISAFN